ncbi:unnamed protein product [Spirodela intermedia]|uniref:Uncharacterized protein n=1 Tax=Spirodela intermedia TaxID=51605 RepID=A0A7I8J3W1_SPIIN|nr:unnamed protein product [Spirodela intermedia]CAA6664071.1 unnamed protein product [Spirodela intermedia]
MPETLSSSPDGDEAVDIETLRSRLNELFESVGADTFDNDEASSNFESFLEDGIAELLRARNEIDLEDETIASLDSEDSDSAKLYGDLVALDLLFKSKKSEDVDKSQGPTLSCRSLGVDHQESTTYACEEEKFKLDHQIEKTNHYLTQLQMLDSIFPNDVYLENVITAAKSSRKKMKGLMQIYF